MTVEDGLPVYVGLDWAAEIHAVCVLDHAGRRLAAFTVEHSADGIASLLRKLAKYGDPADAQVGIERPNGRQCLAIDGILLNALRFTDGTNGF